MAHRGLVHVTAWLRRVPVDEVKRDVNEERITVEHTKEKVMESPQFDPDNR